MFRKKIKKIFVSIVAMCSVISFSGGSAYAELCNEEERTEFSMTMEKINILEDEEKLYYEDVPVVQFRVDNISPDVDTDADFVDWWYSEWEDCRYIFLPSTADRSNLVITYETLTGLPITLNGTEIKSGETTDILSTDDEFSVYIEDYDCGKIKVMQSNLGCVYLSTSTGGLDYLDTHRTFVETGNILMINADGGIEYDGEMKNLKGHGNSSWDYSKKKSYNLKLPEKQNIYGMGKAKKWAFISNYLDHSMLRNVVATEMGKNAGMQYTMDSVFVDLYADGSYRGTYQLIERVQVQKNRVNITDLEEKTEKLNDKKLEEYEQKVVGAESPGQYIENSYKYYDIPNNPEDITGGYLMQFQLYNRYGYKAKSGFITSRGQSVELDGPEYASKEQVEYIRNFVQELEDAIYSETGYNEKGRHYSEYIDVDSLIRAYLIQEIMMNPDGTATSFYMWKESDSKGDGKIHFGPVWDMDLSCFNFYTSRSNSCGDSGYTSDLRNLIVACFPISGYDSDLTDELGSGRPTLGIDYVGFLYKKDDYRKRVAKIYFEEFEPYLKELSGGLIAEWGADMQPSAEMSNARWHTYGDRKYRVFGPKNGDNFTECVDYISKFLEKRRGHLNELWGELYDRTLKGDSNEDGMINLADATFIIQHVGNKDKYKLSEQGEINADVDGKEGITGTDALRIQMYVANIIDSFE